MSRGLSTINETQVDSTHVHDVTLVKLEFDTPVYVHSGIGTITYDGDDYIGVGGFGAVSPARESEALGPAAITLTLSGVDSDYITEAFDAGNLYDVVTIYQGLRQDDGTLYDDPWILWKGWYEYAAISVDVESAVAVTCQHDLSQLSEKDGSRYSDEDQQNTYVGDVGLEFTAEMIDVKLVWGGGPVSGGSGRGPRGRDEPAPIRR